MDYGEDRELARTLAKGALTKMERYKIAPNPDNFMLWYCYCASNLPELRDAIDRSLAENGKVTPGECAELYAQFFGEEREIEIMREAGLGMERLLEQLGGILGEANTGVARYGRTLEEVTDTLAADGAPSLGMADVITTLLSETRAMLEINRQLEARLEVSTREVDMLRESLGALKHEAATDGLTGIANRRMFDVALRERTTATAAAGGFLSLLMIDIDHFKKFNDTHGHLLGDQVLKLVARSLVESIKGQDLAARYGGEEFAVILPDTRRDDAVAVANAICRLVARRKIFNRRTNEDLGRVTLSIGVAEYVLGEPVSRLIARADAALYAAKDRGRNQVVAGSEPIAGDAVLAAR